MAATPQGPDRARRPGRADHHRVDRQRGRRWQPCVAVRPGRSRILADGRRRLNVDVGHSCSRIKGIV